MYNVYYYSYNSLIVSEKNLLIIILKLLQYKVINNK